MTDELAQSTETLGTQWVGPMSLWPQTCMYDADKTTPEIDESCQHPARYLGVGGDQDGQVYCDEHKPRPEAP